MKINLCEIIEMPGKSLAFSCDLETERLFQPAILEFTCPPRATGTIKNTAGTLSLIGGIAAELVCSCDRCGTQFKRMLELSVEAKLTADPENDDSPEYYPLIGDELDLGDLLETYFILNSDASFLCRDDCAGLCYRCGKNLNDGNCGCVKEIDPRLAVLQQLLDKKDE